MVFGIASSLARRRNRKKKKPEEAPTGGFIGPVQPPDTAAVTTPAPTGLSREQAIEIERTRTLTAEERAGLGLVGGERAGGGFDPRAPARTGARFEQFLTERAERAEAFAGEQLEQAGAFEEVTPTRTELSTSGVEGEAIEDVLIAGPVASAIGNLVNPRGFEGPVTEETIREQALRKIRDDAFAEGTSNQVKWGTFIETIPIAGKAVSNYASGLIQTPSGNANDIIREIESLGTEATNNQEKTRSGIMPPEFALARARQMEEQLAVLEGRLKYLVNISPVLQAEVDNVNAIEQKIFETKERTDNFRTAAAFANTAAITGTGRAVPTDEQLFFELKEKARNEK